MRLHSFALLKMLVTLWSSFLQKRLVRYAAFNAEPPGFPGAVPAVAASCAALTARAASNASEPALPTAPPAAAAGPFQCVEVATKSCVSVVHLS